MKMSDTEVLSVLNSLSANAIGGIDTKDSESATSLDYYNGEPYGTEIDGQSQVVSREVMETIEWAMPSLMRVFTSGDKIVQFEPVGQEDEEQAEQETDVINHVMMKHNNGFLQFHNWFKDALLIDMGYIKVWVDESERVETESYMGLSDEAFNEVVSADDYEVLEHSEMSTQSIDPMGMPVLVTTHDIKVKRTFKDRRIKFKAIPKEEIRVHKNTADVCLDDSPYVEHRGKRTISDLIAEGFDKETVKSLPDYTESHSELSITREDQDGESHSYTHADQMTREVEVIESYVRMDYDGDDYAELRKVTWANDTILDNEEVDFIPIEALTPIIMPHNHTGKSLAELVKDLQEIKSELLRQMLTNLYLTNNPQKEVDTRYANLEDLLTTRPGGIIRTKQVGSVREITTAFTAGQSIPMLEILDTMKEARTGISRHTMGLDANTLAQSTKGAFMGALEQANQRIEMIARVFAETGVKGLALKIHRLMRQNPDMELTIKLRNNWVNVSPQGWRDRTDMTVNVGIGTGNKDQLTAKLLAIAEEQKQALQNGLPIVTPKNLFNTYSSLIEHSGFKAPELYFTDPSTLPPPEPPPPDPNIELMKEQLQIERDRNQLKMMELEQKHEREMIDIQNTISKQASDLAARLTEMELKYGQNVPGAVV